MNYQTLYTEIVLPQYAGMTDAEIVAALNATAQARRQVPVAALYATALATGAYTAIDLAAHTTQHSELAAAARTVLSLLGGMLSAVDLDSPASQQMFGALALAWIIAGEAPTCPIEAKVAVAQVHANRIEAQIEGGWFGWQEPGPQDVQAALIFRRWPDLVSGALYAIGPGDRLKMPWLRERKGRWECDGGDFVEVWT